LCLRKVQNLFRISLNSTKGKMDEDLRSWRLLKIKGIPGEGSSMEFSSELTVKRRRNSLEIIEEILEVVQEGAKKTQVMYSTNLSFKQLENYLNFLLEKGFVERVGKKTGKGAIYRTTVGGQKFLETLKELEASSPTSIPLSKSRV